VPERVEFEIMQAGAPPARAAVRRSWPGSGCAGWYALIVCCRNAATAPPHGHSSPARWAWSSSGRGDHRPGADLPADPRRRCAECPAGRGAVRERRHV